MGGVFSIITACIGGCAESLITGPGYLACIVICSAIVGFIGYEFCNLTGWAACKALGYCS